MQLFLRRSRGSITVFVTLILVPTVFFTSFLVDLARIKLYSNQAVMTADNYGETVLTYYDNVLKELYGLFSVTQNEEALNELDTLKGYMESSFNPNNQGIDWAHLKESREYVNEKLGSSTDYSGFMPYSSAEISMDYEAVNGANLGTPEILSSQIGDFMKFRIVQCIGDDGSDVLEALDTVQNLKGDAEAVEKRTEIAEAAEELFEAAELYYDELRKVAQYPDYLSNVNRAISDFETTYAAIISSDEYEAYAALMEIGETEGKAASDEVSEYEEEIANLKEGDPEPSEPDEETYKKADIYDTWADLKPGSSEESLKKSYDSAVNKIINARNSGEITFDLFPTIMSNLSARANSVKTQCSKIKELRSEMNDILNDENVSEVIKDGIREDLKNIDEIVSHVDTYLMINAYIDSYNSPVNSDFKEQIDTFTDNLKDYGNIYFAAGAADYDMELDGNKLLDNAMLESNRYKDFLDVFEYKKVYESLEKCFAVGTDENADKYDKKKDDSKKLLKDLKDGMTDEETDARDIPASFGYGSGGTGSGFDITKMMKDAAKLFSENSMEQEGEKLLLKLYTVEYDFGMFSSRVTPIMENDSGEKEIKESLTGYEMSRKINYLYGAELEYILNGADSSDDNLNAARNKILAFRAIMNFAATYQIKEVNTSIKTISEAASAINPVLGLAVNGALRLAVAGAETYGDWDELKSGNEVFVVKTELKQMTAYDKIKSLIDSDGDSSGEAKGFKMDYENYLMVMMVFLTSMDTVTERTADLIELNVNTVEQKIGSDGELSELKFKMDNAVTAVNASCSVHMDFVVMPDGFAQSAASEDTYSEVKEFEKNSYKFTVTRGY